MDSRQLFFLSAIASILLLAAGAILLALSIFGENAHDCLPFALGAITLANLLTFFRNRKLHCNKKE